MQLAVDKDLPPLADTDWCDHLQKHKISVDRYTA